MDMKLKPNEILWESISFNGKERKVTSDDLRKKYMLYELQDGKWKLLRTATTPLDLSRYDEPDTKKRTKKSKGE